MNEKIDHAARALVESYSADGVKIHHLDRQPLPSHAEIVRVLVTIHELLFPGYIGAQGLTGESLNTHVESRMSWLYEVLTEQIKRAVGHVNKIGEACDVTDREAGECAIRFRSEEHTSELQSHSDLVCRLLLEKKKKKIIRQTKKKIKMTTKILYKIKKRS